MKSDRNVEEKMGNERQQEERAYDYWLSSLEGIGDKTIRKLEKETGLCGGKEIFLAKEEVLQSVLKEKQLATLLRRREESNPEGEYEMLLKKGIRYFSIHDEEYPQRLRAIPDPPYGLFCKGQLPKEEKMSVAVIGARECSEYGIFVAQALGRTLAEAGIQVISGMARGIDGIAQRAACEAGGVSFAVLGCGVDVCYPAGNRSLYERILQEKRGGIISEQEPGRPPLAGFFPARNRIISGLADLVLVVEAREKSGSLITADQALEQGKDVYVVPGRITDELSRGCLNLLKQGAGLADSPKTLLEALHVTENSLCKNRPDGKVLLAKDENIVYSWIRLQPVSLDELVKKTGFPAAKVLQTLVLLQLGGYIREIRKNEYVRTDSRIIDGEVFSNRGVTGKGEDN